MKDKISRFSNKSATNSFLLLIIITIVFCVSCYYFFQVYKEKRTNLFNYKYELLLENSNEKLKEYLRSYNKNDAVIYLNKLIDSKIFDLALVENKRYIFNESTLFDNTNNLEDKSWNLIEVIVDIKYGYINQIPKSRYFEFLPSKDFDKSQPLNIRYQLYKKGEIKNYISKINFSNILITSNSVEKLDSFEKVFDLKNGELVVSSVKYSLNKNLLIKDINNYLFKLVLFCVILYIPIVFVLIFYHKHLFKKYVTLPVEYINNYLDDILKSKYQVLDKSRFEGTTEIKELTNKVFKVSTKIASLENELSLSKESLEIKSSADALTGLANRNIFDFDLKSMFVSMSSGFIFDIRIEKLSEISKNHDTGYINNFIENYANIIKNVIFKYSKTDITLYRFYGSKFAIIAKNIDIQAAKSISEEIIFEITDRLPDIYDVPEELIQIGVTAFDPYGSIDSIVESGNKAFEKSKEKAINSYFIIGRDDIEKDYTLVDKRVNEIILKEDFDVQYILSSYLFDNPEKLVMCEATPILLDYDNNRLQVGSFISVAQKLNLVEAFDKLMILKVISHIKKKELNHEIAINLSILSIQNDEFILWLEDILSKNSEIKDKIVFSITSYTAYMYKDIFTKFVQKIHKIGAKIILKRYKTDEYPLEQLEFLNIDYIRINKDYTSNFTTDLVKKHKVKNIVIFAELNNIKVISDSVKLDSDYDMLERLGLYATSR